MGGESGTARRVLTRVAAVVCLAAGALVAEATLSASQWPGWRGPAGDGVARDPLPTRWSASSNVAWRVALRGAGVSTPAVWGDRVFVTSQEGAGRRRSGNHPSLVQGADAAASGEANLAVGASASGAPELVVAAYSWDDGTPLWAHGVEAVGMLPELHDKHNMASPSPATDGDVVVAWFGNGQVVTLDHQGRPLWAKHLAEEYGGFDITWGHASSPVLHGDAVYFVSYHPSASYVLAVDKMSGDVRWKADRPAGVLSYSTPVVVDVAAGPELVINASTGLEALALDSGAARWSVPEENRFPIPVASVVDNVLFTTRGYRSGPTMAVRLDAGATSGRERLQWHVPTGAPYVSSLVHHDGLLYIAGENGIVMCLDAASGERVWQERVGGVFTASPLVSNGLIYFVSETGETVVIRGGRAFELVARNELDAHFVASPAASRGRLFLRADDMLWAIGDDGRNP
jgi:outer membrane protein assembly factor BamB